MHGDIVIDGPLADRLQAARLAGASDWHWSQGQGEWWRVNGVLRSTSGTLRWEDLERVLPLHSLKSLDEGHSIDCALTGNGGARYRSQWFQSRDGCALSVRILAEQIRVPQELGIPPVVTGWLDSRHGLIVIAGATGAGKSTTLASLLMMRASQGNQNLVTLEDPVEQRLVHEQSRIVQRELGVDFKNYADGVRAALRQDPDVLLIGEIRDVATLRWALLAGQTGHLVLTSVHAQDATQAVQRMIGLFPADEQATMRGILAQVLLGVGVQQMHGTGNARQVAFEVLCATAAVRSLIRENKLAQLSNVIETGAAAGMVSMQESMRRLQLATVTKGYL